MERLPVKTHGVSQTVVSLTNTQTSFVSFEKETSLLEVRVSKPNNGSFTLYTQTHGGPEVGIGAGSSDPCTLGSSDTTKHWLPLGQPPNIVSEGFLKLEATGVTGTTLVELLYRSIPGRGR